ERGPIEAMEGGKFLPMRGYDPDHQQRRRLIIRGGLPQGMTGSQWTDTRIAGRGRPPTGADETTRPPLRRRRLPVEQALAIILSAAEGVQHAHERGILHRDLKPGNIMLGTDGRILVMDFGLAKMRSGSSEELSLTGQFMGTLAYMAPEQAASAKDVDERADVFSLGAILFEMLTGETHFRPSGNLTLDIGRLLEHEPPSPRRLHPDLDAELALVVGKAMARRPRDRYQSARQFIQEVERWRRGEAVHARPPTTMDRLVHLADRNRTIAATILACVLSLLFFGIGFLVMLDQERRTARAAQAEAEKALEGMLAEQGARRIAEAERAAIEADLQSDWLLIHEEDFEDPAAAAEHWLTPKRGQELDIRDGRAHCGSHTAGYFLVFRHQLPGDLRLSFDVTVHAGLLDDISCFMAVPDAHLGIPFRINNMPSNGYAFKIGAWNNSRNQILRENDTLISMDATPLKAGGSYRVVAERLGGRLRLFCDGRLLFDIEDPDPLPVAGRGVFGLSTWYAALSWDNIRIERRSLPRKVDLFELAERVLQEGRHAAAAQIYGHAKQAAMDMDQLRALQAGQERARLLAEREELAPRYRQRLQKAWPAWQGELVFRDGELHCSLQDFPVSSLEPLRGMRLQHLHLSGCPVSDLSPLQGMPLRTLHIIGAQVDDLDPLQGMPLETANFRENRIVDLGPLRGMPLRELALDWNKVADIGPLADAPLEVLSLQGNPITDLAPLATMPLRRLNISDTRIERLAALAHRSDLRELEANRLGLRDLTPIAALPLETLILVGNDISDISALRAMPLSQLRLPGNSISDLQALVNKDLTILDIRDNAVQSLAPLRGMPLNMLYIDGCGVRDIEDLRGLPLRALWASGNAISDIGPLSGMQLQDLVLRDNPLSRLDGVDTTSLLALDVSGTAVDADSLAILDPLPPYILMHNTTMDAAALRRLATTWDDRAPHLATDARVLAAVQTQDRAALLELATPLDDGRRVLFLPIQASVAQLQATAAQLGTSLFEVGDIDDLTACAELLEPRHAEVWLRVAPQVIDLPPHLEPGTHHTLFRGRLRNRQRDQHLAYPTILDCSGLLP
ncbi:MAG: protein kinase domain-containing protein, partial [Planctomycetota bacterium]